jgi:Uncharacterized protein conserved in bacteria
MSRLLRYCAIAWILSLAGCAASSVHYHTLLAPTAGAPDTSRRAPFLIDVLPVGVPAQLDQPQLVVRQGDSGVTVLDGERWAGPLSEELRAALSSQLVQSLGTHDIAGLPAPTSSPVVRIKLQIHRLDAWLGQRVQLDADWSLGYANAPTRKYLICHGQFSEVAPGGYTELVQAQQRIVAKLAARMTGDASGWMRTGEAMCVETKGR